MSKKQPTASQNDAKTTKKTMKPHKTRSCAKAAKAAKAPASAKTAKTPAQAIQTVMTNPETGERETFTLSPDQSPAENAKTLERFTRSAMASLMEKIYAYRETASLLRVFAMDANREELLPSWQVKMVAKVQRTLTQIAARAKQKKTLTAQDAAVVSDCHKAVDRLARAFLYVADEKNKTLRKNAALAAERLECALNFVFIAVGMVVGSYSPEQCLSVPFNLYKLLARHENDFDDPAAPGLLDAATAFLLEVRKIMEGTKNRVDELAAAAFKGKKACR